jgi:hypothetical protein
MDLDVFIAKLKRKTQFGNPNVATDQQAKDVLDSINQSMQVIKRGWIYDWLLDPISITLVPGTVDYTLDADIAKIVSIDAGAGQTLDNISIAEYHRYKKPDTSLGQNTEGSPGWYLYIGRTAAGARKIRIGNIPSASTTLDGFGKLKHTAFTNSQLGTGASFLPFPDDGEDVLEAFVLADIYAYQGKKDLIFPQKNEAESKLQMWRGESTTEPSSRATTNLPDYLRKKRAGRRNGNYV